MLAAGPVAALDGQPHAVEHLRQGVHRHAADAGEKPGGLAGRRENQEFPARSLILFRRKRAYYEEKYYPFFADRSFLYYTGIEQAESVLAAVKDAARMPSAVMASAWRMASISQGFLMVRWAQSCLWQLWICRAG